MELQIKNIGMIRSAELNVDGISVVTGNNDSGKSTIGKALFSLCHGIQSYEKKIEADAMEYISEDFYNVMKAVGHIDADYAPASLSRMRIRHRGLLLVRKYGVDNIEKEIEKIENTKFEGNDVIDINDSIAILKGKLHEIHSDEFLDMVKKRTIERVFRSEFSKNVNNVYSEDIGEVSVSENNRFVKVGFKNNKLIKLDGELASSDGLQGAFPEVNFINTPFVLDDINNVRCFYDDVYTHKGDLISKLLGDEQDESNVIEYALKDEEKTIVEEAIAKVLAGNVIKKQGFFYQQNGKEFSIDTLATGMKTYVVIKMLLDNGYLRPNSLLILDEPEVHLHPSWQLLFAELLVLFNKELGIKVLLATHSPYFLQAIEVYSKKYEIQGKTHFYLSKKHGNSAVLENIDNDLEQTYKLMAEPILILQSMQDELEV